MTTTALSRTSVTAPAPRVVYQRIELDTGDHDPPDTTVPLPDDELTPLEGCRPDDADDCDEDVDDVDAEALEV
jgi:hypothetical protein